jgi:hypothetical protein
MKKLLLIIILLLIIVMITWSLRHAWAVNDQVYQVPYDALLKQYVRQGDKHHIRTALVDYEEWGRDHRHGEAMRLLVHAHPDRLAGEEAIAFWVNTYNLLTIDLIVKQKETGSIKHIGGWFTSPWKAYRWMIGRKSYSLDEIEHGILRTMGEPRIHMAIVCASISCPDLRAEAYTADALDRQLDDQVSTFLRNDAKGVRLTPTGLEVSRIFKWFADDFAKTGGVVPFIRRYMPQVPPDADIADYLDYNWSLNSTP